MKAPGLQDTRKRKALQVSLGGFLTAWSYPSYRGPLGKQGGTGSIGGKMFKERHWGRIWCYAWEGGLGLLAVGV
jgi:hypothetical protein